MKWDGVPADIRESLEFVLTSGMGRSVIKSLTIEPYSPPVEALEINGKAVMPNLTPLYTARCTFESSDGKFKGGSNYAIGLDNGVWRICGMKWQDSK